METVLITLIGFVGSIAATVYGLKYYFNRQTEMTLALTHVFGNESVLIKKFSDADLSQHSGLFLRIGFILSLLFVIIIFSLTFYFQPPVIPNFNDPFKETEEILDIPITYRDDIKMETPPPVAAKKIELPIQINLIDVDDLSKNETDMKTTEIDETSKIDKNMMTAVSIPKENINEPDLPRNWAEVMPQFPGGNDALLSYLSRCPFPRIAVENDIEGIVFVEFIIDKDGNVTDAKVVRSNDKILSEAALTHVKNMPKWEAGMQNGNRVKVKMVSKIAFKLKRY
jgi:protein TonB